MGHRGLLKERILAEICGQPEAVARTIAGRTQTARAILIEAGLTRRRIERLQRVVIVATGSSYHAAVVARYTVSDWARLPCDVDVASEWRDRSPILDENTLVIGLSPTGEDPDTLAAIRLARDEGAWVLAVTEAPLSATGTEANGVLATRSGAELDVAATKTFTAQAALMYLIALALAEVRRGLPPEGARALRSELETVPRRIAAYLRRPGPVETVAEKHYDKKFVLYLGRHLGLPVCLEGALKLKEIAGIPTEAYSAGEMKHGPIALLDESTPVICVATDSHVHEKLVSNIQETRARGARVVAVATEGNDAIRHDADDVIFVPRTHPFLQPLLAVVPLQLLAYRIATLRDRTSEPLEDGTQGSGLLSGLPA